MKNQFPIAGLPWLMLTLICVVIILYGLNKAMYKTTFTKTRHKKIMIGTTVVIVLWIGLLTVLSSKGFFADFSKLPPRPALVLLLPLPVVLLFAFSKTGTQILRSVPPHWLVLFQTFRVFVELLLLLAFLKNILPVQMTFEGRNFDVLTGLLALPAAYFIRKRISSSAIIIAFNIIGLLLLINILIIAVLSMPAPIRYFMNEPSNTLVAQFPFILLPGVLVPIAYSFHIFSLRQLYVSNHLK